MVVYLCICSSWHSPLALLHWWGRSFLSGIWSITAVTSETNKNTRKRQRLFSQGWVKSNVYGSIHESYRLSEPQTHLNHTHLYTQLTKTTAALHPSSDNAWQCMKLSKAKCNSSWHWWRCIHLMGREILHVLMAEQSSLLCLSPEGFKGEVFNHFVCQFSQRHSIIPKKNKSQRSSTLKPLQDTNCIFMNCSRGHFQFS